MAARTNNPQTTRTTVKGGARSGAGSGGSRAARGTVAGSSVAASARARDTQTAEDVRRVLPRKSVPGRRKELVALVMFAIAIFLFVVLIAGGAGGVLGRGSAAGLGYAFGHLALVIPVLFVVFAVTTVLNVSLRRSYWLIGGILFLFGLFLLVAAGAPPFGGHGADYFVSAEFKGRAGGLGEALYALFHKLAGTLGVGIIGWVAVLAGFSLATGMTAAKMAHHTKRAAGVVRDNAGRGMTMMKDRGIDDPQAGDFDFFPGRGTTAGWQGQSGTSPAAMAAPRLGPVDLVGQAGGATPAGLGAEFDDWDDVKTEPAAGPSVTTLVTGSRRGSVLDGAEAFADLYDAGDPRMGAHDTGGRLDAGGSEPPGFGMHAAPAPAAPAPVSVSALAAQVAGSASVGPLVDRHDHTLDDSLEALAEEQEALPGLARKPRQIELPVEVPNYLLPDSDILKKSAPVAPGRSGERDTANVVLQALGQFGVEARVVGMVVGPRVTRYELQLAPGTKVSKVSNLKDDLAYALATTEIRILAPIPGKSAVGVEVPNQRPDFVTLGDIYRDFPKGAGPLMAWLGKDISGKPVFTDLSKLPHLLIAGTTGSGKSGCVNCIISSILLRSTPEQVRIIMIDPKKVELSHYDRIPHLLVPVVTNMKDAAGVLHNVCKEMEDRYELMELEHCRNLADMNKVRAKRGERAVPYMMVVIDELADLMMVSPQEVEEYVIRLAQKSRAVGIHLVVATQRPSADVITGMIKANIPSRIAFAVSSQIDSRVILDVNGAETLLGRGDMLFKPLGSSHMERVQGAFITEDEISLLVNHWRHQAEPDFREELLRRPPDPKELKKAQQEEEFDPDADDLLADAAQLVIETGSASVSMLQRRLRVGYTRAGRLIDMLERRGVVGPWEGSKPRQILVDADEAEHVLAALRLEGGDTTVGDDYQGD